MPTIDDYEVDPELPDENDPQFREEVFQILKVQGCKPEDLIDPEDAALYAEWLKTAGSETE